ncbi:MAG TPA: AAA domain-containing protein, partial [Acetobacteraceae bacterium]|nr:AAA domain-containing protein [Acetobacteraceae bacterium]
IANILAQAVMDAIAMPPAGSTEVPRRIPGGGLLRPCEDAALDALLAQGWTTRPVTVLFVAEKLAALEVVKRRLETIGLGAACLELHSEKQSKRAVLDELRATLAIPAPPRPERRAVVDRLGALRSRLNRHAAAVRDGCGASGIPLHRVVGALVALRGRGVGAPDFSLDVAAWDGPMVAAKRGAVAALAARAAEGGAQSVWRGVARDIGPLDAERLMAQLPGWIRAFAAADAALAPAAQALGREAPGPGDAPDLLALASAPAHDPDAMRSAAWAADPAPLRALAEAAAVLAAARGDQRLKPGALERAGLAEARATLAEGGGFFGFLSGTRRAAQALAAEVATDPNDPLPALDAAIAGQAARDVLRQGNALGHAAFGRLWQGEAGDPAALGALVAWRERHGPQAAAALAREAARPDAAVVEAGIAAWNAVREATGLEGTHSFRALADLLAEWAAAPEALPLWQGWRRAVAEAEGLEPIAERLADGRLAPEAAVDAFEAALNEALLREAMRARPELAGFDGTAADRLVEEFRAADVARVQLARAEAASAHAQRLKAVRDGMPGYTVIKGEMEKRRGHLPVRELLLRAGQAIQAAKPIFMMSPLSVAQFLAPPHGLRPGLSFDLMVMDEASQVEPVDALGAIARSRQVVVVGDDKQMPPTRFFQRMTGEEENGGMAPEDAPDAVAARDVESILGLANARGVPSSMLRWHYRSRHESLIATSNANFYDNRLLILPSPRPRSPALGLSLVRVEGQFDTGSSGTNRAEAEAVARAAIEHAKTTPGDTLGIAAFSIRQRDAILDAVEAARRENPETDAFFNGHEQEPFFVKNLENVQGDERDCIMISVGYGRGADGRLAMRFGPLSAEGGERRLNVLITRAKKRCIVFSSIGAEDVDLERAGGRGVAVLKSFLAFAASGDAALRGGDGASPSPLADAIARAVREAGKEPAIRVGTSGVFLDVAARDAESGYVLGVAADGGDWAALRCARDRERGRDAALGAMGWRLMRAWSLSWLARPEAEAARIKAALGAQPAESPAATLAAPETGLAEPYREAEVAVPRDKGISDPSIGFASLADILAQIIRAEQPVATDSVLERARLLWGLDALSAADRQALAQALKLAAQLQGVKETRGFWCAEDAPPVTPRDRRAAAPHLRRAGAVSPEEIAVAAERLLAAQPRATEAELAAGVHRMLGLDAAAQAAVAARIAALVGAGRLTPVART